MAVYTVDSFTAVNLLIFNRWSSKIKPAIPFDVSKWVFSLCILLSFVNLAFEGFRALRVMKRGNVAECFLDSLAVRWESIRFGSGQGWRRFLVFAELAKSKKGSEYVALFTYFSFKSWIRVIFCSGPRQVVNALTLKSVYQTKLAPTATSVDGAILSFFDKIKVFASEDYQQAVIVSGMCFTFVVWVFSALFLLMAVLFYVFFLFHWIPRSDGGLAGYCERKVNKKLLRIVTTKVNTALAKGQANRLKAELEYAKRCGEKTPQLERAATLPTFPNVQGGGLGHSLAQTPAPGRDDGASVLPTYIPRPGSPASIDLNPMSGRRRPMQRTGTSSSMTSFSSRAPLVPSAADMGYAGSHSPASSLADVELPSGMAPSTRPGTCCSTQRSFGSLRSGFGPGGNASAGTSLRTITASPVVMENGLPPYPGLARSFTETLNGNAAAPAAMGRSDAGSLAYGSYQTYGSAGRASPAPPTASYRHMGAHPPPTRSLTGPIPTPRGGTRHYPPQRTMTAPVPQHGPAENSYDQSGMPRDVYGGVSSRYETGSRGYDVESQRSHGYY